MNISVTNHGVERAPVIERNGWPKGTTRVLNKDGDEVTVTILSVDHILEFESDSPTLPDDAVLVRNVINTLATLER